MRRKTLSALGPHGLHRLAYREWGDPANPRVLVCVHGLARNGQDFEILAEAIADGWRVVAPDLPGRGDSEWLPVAADYSLPQYMADCMALIARLDVAQVTWLGTSLGGIIGMSLAALPGTPIRRMVLNDVGPYIPGAALRRIAGYIGDTPHFADAAQAEPYFRSVMADFGVRSAENWRRVTEAGTRPAEGGGLRLHYDPAIAQAFQANLQDLDLWSVWDNIVAPILVLRGGRSDVLTAQIAADLAHRGPIASVVEFPDCGHAPALMEPEQVEAVVNWLNGRG